jgi:hypothetical protein
MGRRNCIWSDATSRAVGLSTAHSSSDDRQRARRRGLSRAATERSPWFEVLLDCIERQLERQPDLWLGCVRPKRRLFLQT